MAENIYNEDINAKFNKKLQFLILIDKMKSVYRQTLLADKSRRETDAEHSWHIALMAMLFSEFAPEGVDRERVIKMCLVHDVVEIYAGDTVALIKEKIFNISDTVTTANVLKQKIASAKTVDEIKKIVEMHQYVYG